MRTQDEIVARVKELDESREDMFGFEAEVLIYSLDYEHAKQFLKPEVEEKDWSPALTEDQRRAAMIGYLEFAWGKAADHRGLSAGRSVTKLSTWAWIFGDDELVYQMRHGPYANYGCPALKAFAEHYGLPVPQDDDIQNMAKGLPCHPGCDEGCGRGLFD